MSVILRRNAGIKELTVRDETELFSLVPVQSIIWQVVCGGFFAFAVAGEEMTMDYSFHGNPEWYQQICKEFNVLTERQIAQLSKSAHQ